MRRELLMVLAPCIVAQIMLKPIKMPSVESLTELKAKLARAGDNLVVIGFLPRSCPHSVKLTPQVEKLALLYTNVVFLKVYEDHDEIYHEYNIQSVPTFVYVKKSKTLDRRSGASIEELEKIIDSIRVEDHILPISTPYTPEQPGILYDVDCYDDFKIRLAEANHKLVVLAFMPSYCVLSYNMVPEIKQLAKKYRSSATFLRIKEEHDDIYEVFDIQTVPTFVFMQDMKKLIVRVGAGIKPLAALLEAVLSGDYTSTTTTTEKPPSHIIIISSPEDLKELLEAAEYKLVVVAFMTRWCSKCKLIAARYEEIADEYDGKVVFLKIDDIGRNKEIYREYNIQRVPTFVFIRNKKKINQYEGTTYEKIKTRIELQDFLNLK